MEMKTSLEDNKAFGFPMTMVAPIVNNNGDTGNDLLEAHKEARYALDEAIATFRKIIPHGRNYQTKGPDEYKFAREAYIMRLEALVCMSSDVYDLAINILGQTEHK